MGVVMTQNAGSFPDTPITLIGQLAKDVDDAWRTFIAIYGPLVYRIARRAGLSENDAEDVLACVMRNFVQAVERGFEVDHDIGLFRSYLKTTTMNEVIAHTRREHRARGTSSVGEADGGATPPPEFWEQAEREQRWQLCLARLKESSSVRARDYDAFTRYALNGEQAQRVAKDLQITVNRLYGIKHAMIEKARRIWKQLEDELGEV